jgi:hypothetical protein
MPSYAQAPGPTPAPPRALNGGLYTGASFAPRAPWANVPLEPDSNVYIQKGLTMGHVPPPGARAQTMSSRASSTPAHADDSVVDNVLEMAFSTT